ncbi:uncharacterized protein [Dermacentor albipictus]|uniref:uncharacterized protein n=1 Tax=Dermacentor albipictus TaxID=60249 RepID=UPI0038FC9A86
MASATSSARKGGTQYCCVVDCHNSLENTKGRTPPVKFYRFPGKWYEKGRRQAWITAVRRVNADDTPWEPSKSTRICSTHFVGNCKSDLMEHPSYIPTIFPPVYRKKAPDRERAERWERRLTDQWHSQQSSQQSAPLEHALLDCSDTAPEQQHDTCERDSTTCLSELTELSTSNPLDFPSSSSITTEVPAARVTDVGCQTECSASGKLDLLLSATNGTEASTQVTHAEQSDKVTGTDYNWKRRCSFEGFNSVKDNEEALRDLCGVTLPVFSLLLNLLPHSRYKSTDVTREDKLCLFLAKHRLGVTFSALAAIFSVSTTTASNVFRRTLDLLSVALEDWVFVPSRDVIKLSLPLPFKEHYPNCTFIIDCTEIRTEMPSKVEQQHVMFSHYKGTYTLKFLVGIIPNGMIAFMSKMYGGRLTDSFITQDSGFLELLKPGDLVLSDKGFPRIRTEVEGKGAVLLMPPFNTNGGQMSQEDMDMTYQIASVRIHVERVIRRLKTYRILSNTVPLTLVPHMKKIAAVCAALVNMEPPIIKKQECN